MPDRSYVTIDFSTASGTRPEGLVRSWRARDERRVFMVADQVLYSASNFLLTGAAVFGLSAAGLGRFAIAQGLLFGGGSLVRAVTGELLVVDSSSRHLTRSVASGAAVAFGAGVGAMAGLATHLLYGDFAAGLLMAACGVALCTQDALRYCGFSLYRMKSVAAADALWLVVSAALAISLRQFELRGLLAAWLVGCLAASFLLAIQLRISPTISLPEWRQATRGPVLGFSVERLTAVVVPVALSSLAAVAVGLSEAGRFKAATAVASPAYTLGAAMQTSLLVSLREVPQGIGDAPRRSASTVVRSHAVQLAGLTIAYGLLSVAILSYLSSRGVTPDALEGGGLLVGVMLIHAVLHVPVTMLSSVLRARSMARSLAVARGLWSLASLVAVAIGGFVGGTAEWIAACMLLLVPPMAFDYLRRSDLRSPRGSS